MGKEEANETKNRLLEKEEATDKVSLLTKEEATELSFN